MKTIESAATGKVASIYEQDGAWAVDDGDGNVIAQGLASEEKAESVASRWVERE